MNDISISFSVTEKWNQGFHTTTARSLQLHPTEKNEFQHSVTSYYHIVSYPPTITPFSTTQKTTPSQINSFPNPVIENSIENGKKSANEQVWPSSALSSGKNKFVNVKGTTKVHSPGRNRFNKYLTPKQRRKNRIRAAKRRINNFYKASYKRRNKNKNRLISSISKYPKKGKHTVFNSKIRRGNAFPRILPLKPYPDHMRHSLLLLMPNGPRIPILETLGMFS